jgi:hypothetical protein
MRILFSLTSSAAGVSGAFADMGISCFRGF